MGSGKGSQQKAYLWRALKMQPFHLKNIVNRKYSKESLTKILINADPNSELVKDHISMKDLKAEVHVVTWRTCKLCTDSIRDSIKFCKTAALPINAIELKDFPDQGDAAVHDAAVSLTNCTVPMSCS